MAFRFRRSIKIAKGPRLNLSKSGASFSVGGRGASLNLGSRGVRSTVGLPGSGLSYSQQIGGGRRGSSPQTSNPTSPSAPSLFGCFGLFAFLLGAVLLFASPLSGVGVILLGALLIWQGTRALNAEKKAAQEELERRRVDLLARFGEETCNRILAGDVWVGQTAEELRESLGEPVDVDEKVLKTKHKEVWKYDQIGANRFNTRVTLEDGFVAGWNRK